MTNTKIIKENKIIIVLILVILAIGGIILLTGDSEEYFTVDSGLEDSTELITEKDGEPEYPEEVVDTFVYEFMKTAPPESDSRALIRAVSFLSEEAKLSLGDQPISGDLAMLVGVQDIPDQGYEISGIEFTDDEDQGFAEVEVTLKYSGGDTVRVFNLSRIDGSWLIDSINID